MLNLTRSRVLDKLRNGETALSFKTNLSCPRTVEIAALAGFDCVWLCNEHVPNDWQTLERQVLAGRAGGTDVMVRVDRARLVQRSHQTVGNERLRVAGPACDVGR